MDGWYDQPTIHAIQVGATSFLVKLFIFVSCRVNNNLVRVTTEFCHKTATMTVYVNKYSNGFSGYNAVFVLSQIFDKNPAFLKVNIN